MPDGMTRLGAAFVAIGADMSPLKKQLGTLGDVLKAPMAGAADLFRASLSAAWDPGAVIGKLGAGLASGLSGATQRITSIIGTGTSAGIELAGATLAGLLRTTTSTIGAVVSGIGQGFAGVTREIGMHFVGYAQSWAELLAMLPVAGSLLGVIVTLTGTLIGGAIIGIGKVGGLLLTTLGGAIGNIGELAASLVESITSMAAGIVRAVAPIVGPIAADIVEQLGKRLAAGLGTVFSAITAPVRSALGTSLMDVERWLVVAGMAEEKMVSWKAKIKELGGVSKVTKKDFQDMAGELTNSQLAAVMGASVGQVQAALDKLAGASAGTMNFVTKRLQSIWEDIGTNIGNIFLPAAKLVLSVATSIVSTFRSVVMPVIEDLRGGVQGLVSTVGGFIQSNRATFVSWGQTIKDIVGNVWAGIKNLFGQLTSGFNPGAARTYWAAVKEGVDSVLSFIRMATTSWENFNTVVRFGWEEAKAGALDLWDSVLETGHDAWDSLREFAISFWEALQEKAVGFWGRIKEIAAGMWEEVKGYGVQFWDAFQLAGLTVLDKLKTAFGSWIDSMQTSTATWVEDISAGLADKLGIDRGETSNQLRGAADAESRDIDRRQKLMEQKRATKAEAERYTADRQAREARNFEKGPDFVGPMPATEQQAAKAQRAQDAADAKAQRAQEAADKKAEAAAETQRRRQEFEDFRRMQQGVFAVEEEKRQQELRFAKETQEKAEAQQEAQQQVKTSGLAEFHSMIQGAVKPNEDVVKAQLKAQEQMVKQQEAMKELLQKIHDKRGNGGVAVLG